MSAPHGGSRGRGGGGGQEGGTGAPDEGVVGRRGGAEPPRGSPLRRERMNGRGRSGEMPDEGAPAVCAAVGRCAPAAPKLFKTYGIGNRESLKLM
jgi:hypothetical protein